MSFNISYTFEAQDQFSSVSRAVQDSLDGVIQRANSLRGKLNQVSHSFISLGKQLGIRVTAPIVAFNALALKQAANLEDMRLKMESFTGSVKLGRKVMQDLTDFTARSPFELRGVTETARLLLSTGTNIKDLIPLLNDLGDISALTNIPLEALGGLLARTAEQGTVSGRVLRMLYREGVPLSESFKDLQKRFHLTGGSLDSLVKKGRITYRDLLLILHNVPKASKAFQDGMQKMSETVSGSFIRLKTNFYLAAAAIGDVIVKTKNLKGEVQFLIDELAKFRKAFEPWAKAHPVLLKWIITIATIAAALSPILITLGMIIWSVQLILAPWLLIVIAIAAIGAGIVYLLTRLFTWQQIMHGLHIAWEIILVSLKIVWATLKLIGYSIYYLLIWPIVKLGKIIFNVGKSIYDHFIKPFVDLYHTITKIFGLLHPGKKVIIEHQQAFKPSVGIGAISPVAVTSKQRVESHLGISVFDPARYIKAVTGSSTGSMSLDVGTNMMFSRI